MKKTEHILGYIFEDDVIKIVDDKNGELYKVFNKLIQDVDGLKSSQKRIERALLGDKDFDFRVANIMPTSDLITTAVCPPKLVNRTTKATYYLNQSTPYTGTTRITTSDYTRTIIEAVCAYL